VIRIPFYYPYLISQEEIKMKIHFRAAFKISVAIILLFQFSGCGSILYPERRGQKAGNIDAGVAVMDGVLLLFFIVPGVIAYVVDFSTGAIYLPGHKRSEAGEAVRVVRIDPAQMTRERIEEVVARETGVPLTVLAKSTPEIQALKDVGEIPLKLAAGN